jgi:hypothetical protein
MKDAMRSETAKRIYRQGTDDGERRVCCDAGGKYRDEDGGIG